MNKQWLGSVKEIDDRGLERVFKEETKKKAIGLSDDEIEERHKRAKEDLQYILTEKTEGTAALKVKSVKDGNGMMSYQRIFGWYVKTSGQALAARARRAGQPTPIMKKEFMMEAIESWEKDVTVLETFGTSYKLNAQTQLLALEAMMANFKNDYEAIERQYPSHIAEGSPEIQLPHMFKS